MRSFNKRHGRSSQGDRDWFTSLYEETCGDLLAFLMRRSDSSEDATDALAEIYRIAWEKRNSIPTGRDARRWLFGVARNVLRRDHERDSRQVLATGELAAALDAAQQTQPTNDAPAQAALAELSELDQEIVTMLAWDGLRPREVADILGLSPNVVRVRAHRAREQLRSRIAAQRANSML